MISMHNLMIERNERVLRGLGFLHFSDSLRFGVLGFWVFGVPFTCFPTDRLERFLKLLKVLRLLECADKVRMFKGS